MFSLNDNFLGHGNTCISVYHPLQFAQQYPWLTNLRHLRNVGIRLQFSAGTLTHPEGMSHKHKPQTWSYYEIQKPIALDALEDGC